MINKIKNKLNYILNNINYSFYNNIYLIDVFTKTGFKLRYHGSSFYYLWSLINPLIMLSVLYVVFSFIMKYNLPHYQLFLLLGIIYWNFVSESTIMSVNSMMTNKSIITTTNIPPYIIIISSCIISFISLLINILVFFIFTIIFNLKLTISSLLLPLYLIELFLIALGISFLLCAIYPKYKDIIFIWNSILLIWFWITPIVYIEKMVPLRYLKYFMLNPLARLINESRDIIIFNYIPEIKQILITVIICVLIFLLGIIIFSLRSKKFAEEL